MASGARNAPPHLDTVLATALAAHADDGVVAAYLFGSEAEGHAHRESDVDVGVVLRHEHAPTRRERFAVRLRLAAALGNALGREVDVVVLNDAPPLFARRVVLDGRCVFRSDPERAHAFVRDVQLRAADLEPFLRRTRGVKLAALDR